jgi:hypothetical protein
MGSYLIHLLFNKYRRNYSIVWYLHTEDLNKVINNSALFNLLGLIWSIYTVFQLLGFYLHKSGA